jgi:hypothetical protein
MRRIPILASLLLAACQFEPTGAQQIDPRPEWRAVWDSAQACTQRRGDYRRLRFFVVPVEGMQLAGHTDGTDIYLREDFQTPFVVKHEMIHALGVHHHPFTPFVNPCHATWESAND